jgi:hypothetical protein
MESSAAAGDSRYRDKHSQKNQRTFQEKLLTTIFKDNIFLEYGILY